MKQVILLLAATILGALIVERYAIRLGPRTPLTLRLARTLRRAGRWLWAAGEGIERGFYHARKVREEIGLEIE